MFYVDGTNYNFPCDVERTVNIQSSDNSGYLLDNTYHNDPLATYITYTVTLAIPIGKESEYSELYELLAMPVAEHSFVFPYNQSTISFRGRIATISDKYYREENGVNIWRGTSFEVTSNEPLFEAGVGV